jgi:hypothetical protein
LKSFLLIQPYFQLSPFSRLANAGGSPLTLFGTVSSVPNLPPWETALSAVNDSGFCASLLPSSEEWTLLVKWIPPFLGTCVPLLLCLPVNKICCRDAFPAGEGVNDFVWAEAFNKEYVR